MMQKKVALIALGCAKNMVDAELALAQLASSGLGLTNAPEMADLILINTCGFMQSARDEAESVIEKMIKLKQKNPPKKIVVIGCYAQILQYALIKKYPEVDAVFGINILPRLSKFCHEILNGKNIMANFTLPKTVPEGARLLSTPPSYAYLRLADGCHNACAYCAIPQIRGSLRSRPPAAIINEAKNLVDRGVRELLLIAQDITAYGEDLHNKNINLIRLIEKLLTTTKIPRLRLLYAHPRNLTPELLKFIGKEPRLCNYLDLPLQHVNSRVLHLMNRHYSRARIDDILNGVANFCPSLTLRSTLITGFPTETETDFAEVLAFVRSNHLAQLGVFTYSPELKTPAYDFTPAVPPKLAEKRRNLIMQAQQKNAFRRGDKRIGTTVEILVDRLIDKYAVGRSNAETPEIDGEIYVYRSSDRANSAINVGDFITAKITKRVDYDLYAKPVA